MTSVFEDLLRILFRRKIHIICFFVIMVVYPMALAYVLPPKYKAKALIYLLPGSYKKPFLPTEQGGGATFMQVSMEDVGSEVEIILSRPILEKVVDETGLDKETPPNKEDDPAKYYVYWTRKAIQGFLVKVGLKNALPPREDAIGRLFDDLEVDFVKRTNIITIEYKNSDRKLARDVVNSTVNNYLAFHINLHGHNDAVDAVRKEMEESQAKLTAAESLLEKYKKESVVSDIGKERDEIIVKISALQANLDTFASQDAKDLAAGNWGDIAGDEGFLDMRKKLTDLEIERIDLIKRYGKQDQNVASVNNAIAQMQELMKGRLAVMKDSWRRVLDSSQKRLAKLEAAEAEISRLQREIDGLNSLYNLNREKYFELTISKAMDLAQVTSPRVAQYSPLPAAPHSPKKMILLIVCVFLGVVGGLCYAYAYDRLTNRVTSVEEVEQITGLPVRATAPNYGLLTRWNPKRLANAAAWDMMPLRKFLELAPGTDRRTVMLVSACHDAGSTFLSGPICAFAANQFSASVICLSVHAGKERRIGKKNHPTLRAVCEGAGELGRFIQRDPTDTFDRLDVGVLREEATLPEKKILELFSALQDKYDYVFVDFGSTGLHQFYFSFTQFASDIILVLAYDKTNRNVLKRMVGQMKENDAPVSGCIFNRDRKEIPGFISQALFQHK